MRALRARTPMAMAMPMPMPMPNLHSTVQAAGVDEPQQVVFRPATDDASSRPRQPQGTTPPAYPQFDNVWVKV